MGRIISKYMYMEIKTTKYNSWIDVIDYTLIEYGRNLNDLNPSKETLATAIDLAKALQSGNLPPPTHVTIGEDCSIIFESVEQDNVYEAIEIYGSDIDTVVFINDEMVEYNSYVLKNGKPIMKEKRI